jgi:hypothetical protein
MTGITLLGVEYMPLLMRTRAAVIEEEAEFF